jgi:hypothetical protein
MEAIRVEKRKQQITSMIIKRIKKSSKKILLIFLKVAISSNYFAG